MRIGFNCLGTDNQDYLIDFHKRYNPSAALVMDSPDLASHLYYEAGVPLVIQRAHSPLEGDEWWKVSPDEKIASLSGHDKNIIAYTFNEPGFSSNHTIQAHANRMVELMNLAADNGYRLVLGNFATGHVQPEWLKSGAYDEVLKLLGGKYKGFHFLGTHEYSIGHVAWGTGEMEVECLWDKAQVKDIHEWPTILPIPDKIDEHFHYWFIRRSDLFLSRANELGIPHPNIILTEWFLDQVWIGRTPSIKEEIRNRYGASGYAGIRGANTLRDAWKAMYPQYSWEQFIAKQWRYAEHIYPDAYVGACTFAWCRGGRKDWDIEYGCNLGEPKNQVLHEQLIAEPPFTAPEPTLPDPATPDLPANVIIPPPIDPDWKLYLVKGGPSNIREHPTIYSSVRGTIPVEGGNLWANFPRAVYQLKSSRRIRATKPDEPAWKWIPVHSVGWVCDDFDVELVQKDEEQQQENPLPDEKWMAVIVKWLRNFLKSCRLFSG